MDRENRGPSRQKKDALKAGADPYSLDRFIQAQERDYDLALAEIEGGRKQSHWMWYVFPQLAGLGVSSISKHYAIKSRAEAQAYLRHPVLGPRLVESTTSTLALEGRTASEVFGSPDDLKLQSCATLFAAVSPPGSVFHQLIDKYFGGEHDERTLEWLATESSR